MNNETLEQIQIREGIIPAPIAATEVKPPSEQSLIVLQEILKAQKATKNCLVFFVWLTVIGLLLGALFSLASAVSHP